MSYEPMAFWAVGNHQRLLSLGGVENQGFKPCLPSMCHYMWLFLNSYGCIVHPFDLIVVQSPLVSLDPVGPLPSPQYRLE